MRLLKTVSVAAAFLFLLSQPLQAQDKYELQSINFDGNRNISSSMLNDVILSEETPWWFWKFLNSFTSLGAGPVYFDSSNISIDIESMREFYNANGFFNTQFSYRYDLDTTDKEVYLTYIINEGKASTYSNFHFYGPENLPKHIFDPFISEIDEDTTEVYNQNVLQSNINEGINYLQNNGYMTARFDSSVIFKDTTGYKADVHFYFSVGNRYRIDTVIVQKEGPGASEVSESLLRKLTDISHGEYYNLEKIRMSQTRLFRTGLFNSINLSANQEDTTDNYVPLQLRGTIGMLNELIPEIVMNNQQSAFNIGLGTTYGRKNFLGNARNLTLSASFGVQDIFNADFGNLINKFSLRDTTLLGYVDTRLTLEQPYLFNKPILGIWETYATVNKQKNYNNTLYGSKITFQFELPRFTFINMLSTYYNLEISKEVYHVRRDSLSDKLISVIGTDFGKTTVDDILFPTRGYIVTMQLEEANSIPHLLSKLFDYPFRSALFYKMLFSSSIYGSLDVKRNQIIAAKLKSGHLQAYLGDYAGIPINRTFYTGGSNSIRGWRSNELTPEDAPLVEETNLGVNFKGGTFLLEGSLEFRQRFLENFGVAVFTDYGNTWLSYNDFRLDEIALAAGFGFRYYTPVAPFRIDFGFRIFDPQDRTYIFNESIWKNFEFHFGIGEAF